MSLSVSNNTQESNMSFQTKNFLAGRDITKTLNNASFSYSNFSAEIQSGGSLKVSMPIEDNIKANYIKLRAKLQGDETLSTEEVHKVCICYTITYKKYTESTDGSTEKVEVKQVINDCFYPRYTHEIEESNKNDYSIIEVPDGVITKIVLEIYNNEDSIITIDNLAMFISQIVDTEQIKEYTETIVQEAVNSSMDNYMGDIYNGNGEFKLVIPKVSVLPSIESVSDGYICRIDK